MVLLNHLMGCTSHNNDKLCAPFVTTGSGAAPAIFWERLGHEKPREVFFLLYHDVGFVGVRISVSFKMIWVTYSSNVLIGKGCVNGELYL